MMAPKGASAGTRSGGGSGVAIVADAKEQGGRQRGWESRKHGKQSKEGEVGDEVK